MGTDSGAWSFAWMIELVKAKAEENDLHVGIDNELVQVEDLPDVIVN